MSEEEDQAAANKARVEETKANQAEDDAKEKAFQVQAAAEQEARKEQLKAEQEAYAAEQAKAKEEEDAAREAQQDNAAKIAADDAAEDAFQEEAAAEQQARQEALAEEQAEFEAEQEGKAEAEAQARREASGDDRTAEEVAEDQAAALAAADAAQKSQDGFEADEDDIGLEETTALEDLEQDWEESGFMGVYSNRVDLLNKLTSNWFSWFPPVRKFPEVNFNFIVMAGLDFLGEFKSVSGISKSLPAKKVNEGGRHHSPHYLPFDGPASRGELKLEWGSVSATSLYEWIQAVRIGWAFQRDVIVVQLARDGWPTRFMRFGNCWPTGWNGADLDTGGSSWALQSLSLVYDDFNMITVPIDLGAMSRQL